MKKYNINIKDHDKEEEQVEFKKRSSFDDDQIPSKKIVEILDDNEEQSLRLKRKKLKKKMQ